MDIFCWSRQLREVQTCMSGDMHILGLYITVIVLLLLSKKRKNNNNLFFVYDCLDKKDIKPRGLVYQIWTVGGPRKVLSFLFDWLLLNFISPMWILKRILSVWLEVVIHHQLWVEPASEEPSSFSSGYTLKARSMLVLSTIVSKLEADGAPMRLIAWSFTFSIVECDAKHFCLTWYVELIYSIKTLF